MLSLALVLSLAAAPGQLNPAEPALVLGRVVDAGTGRPIAGAIVTPAGTAAAPEVPGATPVRVITNAQGNFVLRGLAKGSLVLTATKGGYVDATFGQRRPGGSTQPIPIVPGEWKTDIELRMWKYASIAGVIVDEAGDPVVGTRVQSQQKTFVAGRRRFAPAAEAVTDDRGVYRIARLTPGDYIVVVPSTQTSVPTDVMEAFFSGPPISDSRRMELSREMNRIGSGIAPAGSQFAMKAGEQTFSLPPGTLGPMVTATGTLVYPAAYYPAAASAAQAAIVTLRSGEERGGVDLQVRPLRGVRVSGTLMGPDGLVSGTGVRLLPAVNDDVVEPRPVAATMTDSSGGFTFAAVPAGQYVLRVVRVPRPPPNVDEMGHTSVTPSGTVTISRPPAAAPEGPPPIPPDATLVALLPLSVGERDLTDLIVSLAPGPRVTGRVEFEGTIDKPSVQSLVNMRITLDPSDGSRLDDGTLASETGRIDETGGFKTYGVPPGRYVLRVSVLPAGWFVKGAIYQGRDIADLPLDLDTKDASGVVITFTDQPSSLSGVVRASGGPDPTAVVLVYPVDPAAWSSSGALSRRMRTARAAKDGSYQLQGLPAGEYYVVALQEDKIGEWQDPALLQALARLARTVRLLDGEQKIENLTAAALR
jgi:hypothetical protein